MTAITGHKLAARPRRKASLIGLADLFDAVLMTCGIWLLCYSTLSLNWARPEMTWVAVLLALNGTLALVGFYVSLRRKFPIFLVAFFFDYIFFTVAPAQQIATRFDPIFENDRILFLGILQCLIFTGVAIVTLYFRRQPVSHKPATGFMSTGSEHAEFHPGILFTATTLVTAGLLLLYAPVLFTSRQTFSDYLAEFFDKSTLIFLNAFVDPFTFIGAFLGLHFARQKGSWRWLVLFALPFAGALLINSPLVEARFRLAALVGFALLVHFGWNNTRVLATAMVAGMLISPILNIFRYDIITGGMRDFDHFFVDMDFDALTLMCHVVYYVDQVGYSYGSNILACLLFFVPRAFWPDKSEHVTYYMMEYLRFYRGFETDNLSSPPPCEGYFAFGLIGAILLTGTILFAFLYLERRAEASEDNSPWRFVVSICAMLTMILLRGPLLVGYSEMWGHSLAVLAAVALLRAQFLVRQDRPDRRLRRGLAGRARINQIRWARAPRA